jgi:hypothetical protein
VSVLENRGDDVKAKCTWRSDEIVRTQEEWALAYLRSYVCDGSRCDAGHPVNAGVARSGSFGLLLDRARRCKGVFIGL